MQSVQVTVKYTPVKNCFVYLSSDLLKKFSTCKCAIIKATDSDTNTDNKIYYFTYCQTHVGNDELSLNINPTFGKLLNLHCGKKLIITNIQSPPVLSSIQVRAHTTDDLEIIKLHTAKLQEIILQQINVVTLNQSIVIWLTKNLHITLFVEQLNPNYKYGKLEQLTEVHVLDTVQVKNLQNSQNLIKHKIFKFLPTDGNPDQSVKLTIENFRVNKQLNRIFRVCKLSNTIDKLIQQSDFTLNRDIYCNYNVFIHLPTVINYFNVSNSGSGCKYFFCKLKKLLNNKLNNGNLLKNENRQFHDDNHDLIVRVIIIENNEELNSSADQFETIDEINVFLSCDLMRQLNLQNGGKIKLKQYCITDKLTIKEILLTPINTNINSDILCQYMKKLHFHDKILFNKNTQFFLNKIIHFTVKFIPDTVNYVLLTRDLLKKLPITVENCITDNTVIPTDHNNDNICITDIVFTKTMKTIIDDCTIVLATLLKSFNLSQCNCYCENILIVGDVGVGKTTLCKKLIEIITVSPYWFYTKIIDCKKLKGKKVDVINKLLQITVCECVYYQPSVLIIDNIDCITHINTVDKENTTPDTVNASRIADAIVNNIMNYQKNHCLTVLATCTDTERLGNQFKTNRGLKLFTSICKIRNLNADERLKIVKKKILLKNLNFAGDIDWDFIGNKMEGYVIQDLIDFTEKAIFLAWKRVSKSKNMEIKIQHDDFLEVLTDFHPISMHGVTLFTGTDSSWNDLGGLHDVKECLVQLLRWPLVYTELFKSAPIKQQSGVLLYGMPGTGKTMIAGAIANECGLNFINIKGPELLSKYIGASEEAVRDIFNKAQRAKPCVLFFDEFESLAPRRGHDSTGVTDRVVNQLLTQFDGIEGREGVAIVAASSRPDLLDPALLRPGRLDKSLLCPVPDENDRMEILEILCRKYQCNTDNIDIKILAKMSDGFTGADLNSVFTQAQLNALDENYDNLDKFDSKSNVITITHDDLVDACESTRPSLTQLEIIKFNRIYEKFASGDDHVSREILKNQKSTLA